MYLDWFMRVHEPLRIHRLLHICRRLCIHSTLRVLCVAIDGDPLADGGTADSMLDE